MNASIRFENGAAWIDLDGQRHLPVAYRSFRPQAETIRRFSDRGFAFYGVFPSGILCSLKVPYSQFGEVWTGEGRYDWDNLHEQVDLFTSQAPGSRFALMVHLDTRDWFLAQNPQATDSFSHLAQMAGWTRWRQAAARFLTDMLDELDAYAPGRVFAVFLFAGATCEWYTRYPEGLEPNPVVAEVYRQWNGPEASIPDREALLRTRRGVFRDPVADSDALRYWRFHSEVVADAIGWFARRVKTHTQSARLVGVFYGYLMELPNPRMITESHNAFTQVLNDQNVDILFAPASYTWRTLDSTSAFLLPVDSLRLHKKLYFHEIDNTTHLANNNPYAQMLQRYAHKRMANETQTVAYSRREAALAMMHGQGYWWFDMFGGWFDSDSLMDQLAAVRDATARFWQADMRSASEVAVFVDQPSNDLIAIDSCVNECLVKRQAEALGRMGAPWDCYVADDLCHPELDHASYKLYIFLNLFKPSDAICGQIQALRQAGKSLLFLYAPGFVTQDGFFESAMRDLTGLPLIELADGGTGQIQSGDVTYGFSAAVAPLFTLDTAQADGSIEVLGHYTDLLRPALLLKQRKEGFDAWSGAGPVPGRLLRDLARRAGVFIYADTDDPLYVNRSLFGLYAHRAGERLVRFPTDVVLQDVCTDEPVLVSRDRTVRLTCSDDEMKLFLVTSKQ